MQSTNSEYGSPYLAVCHFHFFFSTKFKDIGFAAVDTIYSIMYKILKMHSDLLQLSKNIWMGSGRVIYVLGMGRFDTITILVCQYDMYCNGFFRKNFDSTSIAIQYCYVLRFLFLTLDHGEKLNDTLNIQTVTIKKHTS